MSFVARRLSPVLAVMAAVTFISANAWGRSGYNDPASDKVWAKHSTEDADYDRLDGTGKSGKKVNVVEWEGNLEIHVYPAGSLAGLGLKLDKKDGQKVMVIAYRFDGAPDEQIVRRAVLGIDMHEGFKAYKDPSADGYDKVVISNSQFGAPLAFFKLDAAPKQLYPDGHPALAKTEKAETRVPASTKSEEPAEESLDEDTGTIHPFFMQEPAFKKF